MKKIFYYLKPSFGRMSLGLTIKFVGTIMDLLLPWLLSYLIDEIVPQKNVPLVLLYGFYMLLCSFVAWSGNVTANRMASRVARDTAGQIRHDLYSRISYLSSRQIDEYTIPSLESRLTTDTYNIHQMIGMMQRLGVRAPILLIGGIFVTLTLEPFLTLVLLSTLPFIGSIVFYISRKGIPLFGKQQQALDKLVRTVRENASGIRVIKALSKSDYEKERFAEINENLVQKETHAAKTMAASGPLMNLFLNLGLTLVVIAGAYRVYTGAAKPGVILAFLTYFTIILNALLSINRMFMLYSKGAASANRIAEILDAPKDLDVLPEDAAQMCTEDAAGRIPEITFRHVSFSYHGTGNAVTDIDFDLYKGQTLGIIGGTGCGKTTLMKLLLRLYDPNDGTVLIGGRDIRTIAPEELYQMFGVVFQNDFLYSDTLEENIRFGRQIEHDALCEAVEHAQAAPFVSELSDGLAHTLTIRGTNLSGGQKQRVLIARALAANPRILILDDSSSALDYKTDASLRQAIRSRENQTTSVIIAQRISSIQYADHILMLEHGTVIGSGTHDELMQNCASYREIAEAQMGGI